MIARYPTGCLVVVVLIVLVSPSSAFADVVYTYGGDCNIPLADKPDPETDGFTEVTLQIDDPFVIADLDVQIDITHTWITDLQIFLEGPSGQRICLNLYDSNDIFNETNYVGTIFDDEAPVSIEDAEPPFTGRFRPIDEDGLTVFDGQPVTGTWQLEIFDLYMSDTGTLDGFRLFVTVPECSTVLFFGFGLLALRRRRVTWSRAAGPAEKQISVGLRCFHQLALNGKNSRIPP